jgi:hypothetical protein
MAEQKEPTLVKPDGTRQTTSETPVSRADFLAAVQAIVGGVTETQREQIATLAEAIGSVRAEGETRTTQIAQSLAEIKADMHKGDYNIANFPGVSAFNPLGEKAHPRPTLKGEVSWMGDPVRESDYTAHELALFNQITKGVYHNGQWEVIDLQPGRAGRRLFVKFPCADKDQAAQLPGSYLHPTEKEPVYNPETQQTEMRARVVTGVEQMLREMVETAAARDRVSVSA